MGQIGEMLAVSAKRCIGFGEAMTKGITPQIAARKPTGFRDGKSVVIDTNHATFLFGHLSLYPVRLWTVQGLDEGDLAPSAKWLDLFKAGAPCHDDPSGSIYPAWDEVLARYRAGYAAAMAALPGVADEVFFRPNPIAASREVFPTVGSAVAFYFGSHTMVHFGQVSTWRRCFGLGSAM